VRVALAALLLACGASVAAQPVDASQLGQISKDSIWVPTPERLIHRMLQLADTTPNDVVLDLGSGDGRIPIHAAARHYSGRLEGDRLAGESEGHGIERRAWTAIRAAGRAD
jgi:hypothetical protein